MAYLAVAVPLLSSLQGNVAASCSASASCSSLKGGKSLRFPHAGHHAPRGALRGASPLGSLARHWVLTRLRECLLFTVLAGMFSATTEATQSNSAGGRHRLSFQTPGKSNTSLASTFEKKCHLKLMKESNMCFGLVEKRITLCRKCSARGRLHSTLENVNSQRLAFPELKPLPHTGLPHTCPQSADAE